MTLASKEFDVLALLAGDRGAVVTRERLMDEVWDSNWFGSTKTLDVTVGRLRQKLEEHHSPSRVVTVRGVGFRLGTTRRGRSRRRVTFAPPLVGDHRASGGSVQPWLPWRP